MSPGPGACLVILLVFVATVTNMEARKRLKYEAYEAVKQKIPAEQST